MHKHCRGQGSQIPFRPEFFRPFPTTAQIVVKKLQGSFPFVVIIVVIIIALLPHPSMEKFNTPLHSSHRLTISSITDGVTEQYSYIPPFNADATTAAEVYIFDESILSTISWVPQFSH